MKKEKLDMLLKNVQALGLEQYSIDMSREYLQYNEYELCFDIIAEHLYEDNIKIDKSTYEVMMSLIKDMKLSKERYSYLKELMNKEE